MTHRLIFTIILTMLTTIIPIESSAHPNPKRLLLSELRAGDYAHAGDTEAIDIVINKVLTFNSKIKSGHVIDIGCGFGGTLSYMKDKGFQHLSGIDIDQNAIDYARVKYRDIEFNRADALSLTNNFKNQKFNLITLFNSIYAISDKRTLLSELAKISHPGAIIAIFDYEQQNCDASLPVLDFAGKPMMPVCINQLKLDLSNTGWEFLESQNLSNQFITWYSKFLSNFSNQKTLLEQKFTTETINSVQDTFAYFLNELRVGKLGGIAVYARKKG